MYSSIILPAAKADIRAAAQWYQRQKFGLGKQFTSQVREKLRFIREFPRASAIRYDEVRTTVLEVFPFMIHYTVDEATKTVTIAAVLHTSRDPEEWDGRA